VTVASRAVVAALAAVSLCAAGYVALVISIHTPEPLITAVQWLGLPVFSIFAASPLEHSNSFYNLTIVIGGALWFMLVFILLPRRLNPLGRPSR
jgi:hypothetical protein